MDAAFIIMHVTAVVACGTLFGAMLSFTGLFAPQVFVHLDDEHATPFMRAVFPRYYHFAAVFAAVAAAGAAVGSPGDAVAMALIAVSFVYARYWLMPLAHRMYDARAAGEYKAAEEFVKVQKRGAFLNMVQFVTTLVVLVRLAM